MSYDVKEDDTDECNTISSELSDKEGTQCSPPTPYSKEVKTEWKLDGWGIWNLKSRDSTTPAPYCSLYMDWWTDEIETDKKGVRKL